MVDRSAGYTVGGAGQTAHSYGYDDLNRLVSGSASGGEFPNFSSTWIFEALGNMTNKAGMIQGYPASGPSSVRPHAVITSSNAYNGNYNCFANGNMTTRMDASVTYTHTWDAQNRPSGVTAPGKDTAWTYDADGARTIKVSGPITTVYIPALCEVEGAAQSRACPGEGRGPDQRDAAADHDLLLLRGSADCNAGGRYRDVSTW